MSYGFPRFRALAAARAGPARGRSGIRQSEAVAGGRLQSPTTAASTPDPKEPPVTRTDRVRLGPWFRRVWIRRSGGRNRPGGPATRSRGSRDLGPAVATDPSPRRGPVPVARSRAPAKLFMRAATPSRLWLNTSGRGTRRGRGGPPGRDELEHWTGGRAGPVSQEVTRIESDE